MSDIYKKIENEKKTIYKMIYIYCNKNHKMKNELCDDCKDLFNYSKIRIEKCPFIKTKTFCSSCKVHCYRKDMREKIRNVMKFSGPKMILFDPINAIKHVIDMINK